MSQSTTIEERALALVKQCKQCAGERRLWADGKAHYPAYTGPTVACPACGGTGTEPLETEDSIAFARAERELQREKDAELIPQNWLDPLLSCAEAMIGQPPYTCSDVERLLIALRATILAQDVV